MRDAKNYTKVQLMLRANYINKGGLKMALINVSENDISGEAKKQKQKVVDKIKNIDAFLSFTPNPEKKEYTSNVQYLKQKDNSPNVIKQKAEANLKNYKELEHAKINQDALNKIADVSNKENKVTENYTNKEKESVDNFEALKESKEQKLAHQGLGRSTIKDNSLKNVEEEKNNTLQTLREQVQTELGNLQAKKAELEKERDLSLENFDIQYAIKLQEKIDSLTKDVEDYNDKVIKYNNSLQAQEEQRALNYEKQALQKVKDNEKRNQELVRFLNKYGYGNYASFVQEEKVQMVKDYLNSLSKQDALQALLEDDEFKDLIGETYFNKLLQDVQERAN